MTQMSRNFVGYWEPCDCGALLGVAGNNFEFYWANAESQTAVAASGVLESLATAFEYVPAIGWLNDAPESAPAGIWFAEIGFDQSQPWEGFENRRLRIPRILFWYSKGRSFVAAFGREGTAVEDLQRQVRLALQNDNASKDVNVRAAADARVIEQNDLRYSRTVTDALESIAKKEFSKVVAAREIEVESDAAIDVRVVLKRLEASFPACQVYATRGVNGDYFLGATPETLVAFDGMCCRTEAVAGTSTPEHAAELLRSEKIQREHSAVIESIQTAARAAKIERLKQGDRELRRYRNVAHVVTSFEAGGISLESALQFAKQLHPTSAVCGTPREAALTFILNYEGFSRGLYAGVVGLQSDKTIDFKVALRCARVRGQRATLFVGAGVVEGTSEEEEVRETAIKAQALLNALGAENS